MVRNKKLQEIDLSLNSLVVFRRLLTQEVILPLRALLDTETMDPLIQLRKYTEFLSRLFVRSTNLTEYIFSLVCEDDNFYVRAKARGDEIDEILEASVVNELAIIERLARLRPQELQKEVSYYGVLPEWRTSDIHFPEAYQERMAELHKYGYGQFARSNMFIVRDEQCVPVRCPDRTRLSELVGYEKERAEIEANTRALLAGKRAQNVLLSGDAGTGKSAIVKALVNEYAGEGLRLIQLTQEQLPLLPDIMDEIRDNPLKFILFLDDLSFAAGDSSFCALKAMLEGSVSARVENAVIYATSNRRHIVQERLAGCEGADIYDTLQEQRSLAERFGVRVNFTRPDKEAYLKIVQALADAAGLHTAQEQLAAEAEQYAQRIGGRSPRAAKQCVELLLAQKNGEQTASAE